MQLEAIFFKLITQSHSAHHPATHGSGLIHVIGCQIFYPVDKTHPTAWS